MSLTPYELRILLDVYVGAEIPSQTANAQIFSETAERLIERGLILPYGDKVRAFGVEFEPTKKLNVLMHYILSAPDPEWRMP